MLNRYKGVKSPELPMNTTVQIFIDFISLTQVLEIHTILLKYTCIIRKLC